MIEQAGLLNITLSVTTPIFTVIAVGFLAVRLGVFPESGVRVLGAFVAKFALPALLLKSLCEKRFSEIIQLDYLLVYGLGSLLAFGLVFIAAKQLANKDLTGASIYGMGGSISNSLVIGYPIAVQVLGETVLVPIALTLIVENLIMMLLALALADIGGNKREGFFRTLITIFPTLLKNPIILALLLGVMVSLFEIPPPALVVDVTDKFAASVAGVALFAVGGMLVGLKVRDMMRDVSLIMCGKLVLHPLCVLLFLLLMPPMDPTLQMAALLLACLPMFGIFPVIGQRYELGGISAAALVPTTLISFVTITMTIWLLGRTAFPI